ncbi:hypothetical protein CRE_19551 [Caenorhabditis remanei]|uniref:DNA-directed DNA polymerase n=1 Tax=Caenorhabditis remanei TaxID=31234 RepID=E3NLF9_CAERE|nr:hypothetical protein CRE_19551 [Caenorhabditis remanei]
MSDEIVHEPEEIIEDLLPGDEDHDVDGQRRIVPVPENYPKFVKRRAFPSAEELEYFGNFAEIVESTPLERISGGILELESTLLKFKNFENLPTTKSLDIHISQLFDIFIRKTIQQAGGSLKGTKYWLCLRHPDWPGEEIWINHSTHFVADGHTLVNSIAKVMQSNKELKIDETLSLHMKIFTPTPMTGSGGPMSEQVLKIFGIKNPIVTGDGFCLPKALAIGKIWSDWKRSKKDTDEWKTLSQLWKKIVRPEKSAGHSLNKAAEQKQMAKELLINANMDPNQSDHDLSDLAKLADCLKRYQIVVWSAETTNVPTMQASFNKHMPGFIGLLYNNGHFDFFVPKCEKIQTRFCFNCSKLVDKRHSEKCDAKCWRCGMVECTKDFETVKHCEDCNIEFAGQQCFDQHLEKRSGSAAPYCQIYERCAKCFKIGKRYSHSKVFHVCGAEKFCRTCQKMVKKNHECHHALYSDTAKEKKYNKQEEWTMVILDVETIVTAPDADLTKSGPKHEVNLVTFRIICDQCNGNQCYHCGSIQNISYILKPGEKGSVLDRFCNFLTRDTRLKNAYLIAHNGGRYDYVFLMSALAQKMNVTPDFVCNGSTFISATFKLKDRELVFRDSCQFMPMKLSSMPKAFGLDIQAKGHFPYLLNYPESYGKTWDTKPPKKYYQPEYMSVEDAKEFEKWYEETYNEPFDFDEEILKYCLNDTEILTSAVCKYIKICGETFGSWNPIIQCPTLASFVMFIMSMEHFSESDVAYIPENGFPGRNNSVLALKYLRWLEHKDPTLNIQHSLKGNEHKIGPYYVDGYVAATNTVLEVNGCLWHGCPRCYNNRQSKCPRRKDFTMEQLYHQTLKRQSDIENLDFNMKVIWECEIQEELEKNKEMKDFFKRVSKMFFLQRNCRNTYNLLPREAMYGGRTQQFKTFAKADETCTVEYQDFCSLYPFINMIGKFFSKDRNSFFQFLGAWYPAGQPSVETSNFLPLVPGKPLPYRGLIFCDVLPPTNLDLPVLPYRSDGKLIFPLCRTCANKTSHQKCVHLKISERYLTGTWTSDELNLAISKGYQILKFHEVWHWPDGKWFNGGFFKKFLAPLLVIKHQASGWPRENMTDEEKEEHVRIIEENDGVRIDPNLVEFNPALRHLAKLFLNSAWGKFAQNPEKTETRLMSFEDHIEICKFFEEPGYEPKMFKTWTKDMAFVSRRILKEALVTTRFTNIMYGIVTTSAARIRLYDAMQRVGVANLIYCDTDSVMFTQTHGQDLLGDLKGEGLGKMTNEVPKGKRIVEVVTVAPKVYGIQYEGEDCDVSYTIKAKGVTLNKKSAETVTFASMKQMAS